MKTQSSREIRMTGMSTVRTKITDRLETKKITMIRIIKTRKKMKLLRLELTRDPTWVLSPVSTESKWRFQHSMFKMPRFTQEIPITTFRW